MKFLKILFFFEIDFNFFKASFSDIGSSILSSSLSKIFSGTVPTIKSFNDLYPTTDNIFAWSFSDGPICLLINSFELSSII